MKQVLLLEILQRQDGERIDHSAVKQRLDHCVLFKAVIEFTDDTAGAKTGYAGLAHRACVGGAAQGDVSKGSISVCSAM